MISMISIDTKVKLNNGVEMPIFGLGLYQTPQGDTTINAVNWAYQAGYRMFDTAQVYNNEKELGTAIKRLQIKRDEVFITTKLWNTNHSRIQSSFAQSLKLLDTEYVDLFLMHWPVEGKRLETWETMTSFLDDGRARAIGVSNFMPWHMDELLENTGVTPAVNQIELSAYLNDQEIISLCRRKNIAVEAYSSLTRGQRLADEKLIKIAKKYNKSPAQILIRWVIDNNLIVILIPSYFQNLLSHIKGDGDIFRP